MDVKDSEWNDEQIVVRMWVGYIWNGRGCLVLPWLQNHKHGIGIYYCNIIELNQGRLHTLNDCCHGYQLNI